MLNLAFLELEYYFHLFYNPSMRIKEFLNDFKNDLRKNHISEKKRCDLFSILTVVLAFCLLAFYAHR